METRPPRRAFGRRPLRAPGCPVPARRTRRLAAVGLGVLLVAASGCAGLFASPQERQTAKLGDEVQRGRSLVDQARYEEAEPILQEAVEVARGLPGPSLPRAEAFYELGNLYVQYPPLAQPGRAAGLLAQAVAEYEALLGPDHPAVGVALSVEGDALHDDGDLEQAARLEERAREIFRRTLPPDNPLRLAQELDQPMLLRPDELIQSRR